MVHSQTSEKLVGEQMKKILISTFSIANKKDCESKTNLGSLNPAQSLKLCSIKRIPGELIRGIAGSAVSKLGIIRSDKIFIARRQQAGHHCKVLR